MTSRPLALACAALALCCTRALAQTAPAPAPADTSARVSVAQSVPADSAAAVVDTVFACEGLKPVPRPLNPYELTRRLERAHPQTGRGAVEDDQVTLRLIVGRDGYVESVQALQSTGSSAFRAAAVQAATVVRLSPPKRDGVPVRCWADVPISYHARR